MKRRNIYIILASALLFAGCGSTTTNPGPTPYSLKEVNIPAAMNDPEARKIYILDHFWDSFAFADTTQIAYDSLIRNDYANYAVLFKLTDEKVGIRSVQNMMRLSAVDSTGTMTNYFLGLTEDYLYDPNSPFRNEELYIATLEETFALDNLDSIHLLRPRIQYERLLWNRRGHRANDLPIQYYSGPSGNLEDIKTDYTLLYFYHPECNTCSRDIGMTNGNTTIRRLIENGRLTAVAYYKDIDSGAYKVYPSIVPKSWKDAHKPLGINSDSLKWDIRATPSIYVLDKNKTVMLKDADYDILSIWLRNNNL